MKFESIKLKHTIISSNEIKKRSKIFYNLIKKRRSIREFSLRNFDDEIIKSAIKSAGTAPNGANLQPWHFVVIKDKKIKKEIRKAAEKEEKRFYNKVAPIEWLDALKPLGTDTNKEFLETKGKQISEACSEAAPPCECKILQTFDKPPAKFNPKIVTEIEQIASDLGYPNIILPSGAFHDAGIMASYCPTAMIFVPCAGGISHNEAEFASPTDLVAGAKVLAACLADLAA